MSQPQVYDEQEPCWVESVTDAPPAYDGFGTFTAGVWDTSGQYWREYGLPNGGPYRRVFTPKRHVVWQRERYMSGLHLGLSMQTFIDRFTLPIDARDFVAR